MAADERRNGGFHIQQYGSVLVDLHVATWLTCGISPRQKMASPLQLTGGQAVGGWALTLVRGQAPVLGEHQPPRMGVFLTAGYWASSWM